MKDKIIKALKNLSGENVITAHRLPSDEELNKLPAPELRWITDSIIQKIIDGEIETHEDLVRVRESLENQSSSEVK